MKPLTFWRRLGRAAKEQSFVFGSAVVTLFVLLAVLGPEIAPHDPYLRDRVQMIDGELRGAPFAPSELYPLGTDDQGRDLLSMLLHGARQTLAIAFVAMTVRLLLGLILGTISGWWPGSLIDRAIGSLVEALAAVPGLILAMLAVFAIGIRSGQLAFVVALSLVGWGDVTQIVRGHVLTLRKKLYVLAARAVGLSSAQVLSRHVLPNLLAALLALSALEMGAALLLLGELGFVHVFIGGGGLYIVEAVGVIHYFDVPDWGAMLGTSWRYFRTLPWMAMAPALAFFVSILGFNLFGYGLQRFVEKGRFHPSGWSLARFLGVVVLVLMGARALLASTSLEARFAELARQFDVQRAWNDVAVLSWPEMEGRPTGSDGALRAASYIGSQFHQSGLTDLPQGGYYQVYSGVRGWVTGEPTLQVLGPEGEPRLRLEEGISFDPLEPFLAERDAQAELMVLANAGRTVVEEEVSTTLLLMLDPAEEAPGSWVRDVPFAGILRLVPDQELIRNDIAPTYQGVFGTLAISLIPDTPNVPNLLIGQTAAGRLLGEAGLVLEDLQEAMAAGERIVLHTGLTVRLEVGLAYEQVTAANVIGYLPGADARLQGERILVAVGYTGPYQPEGPDYPGADEDASGVAVMLEVARLLHDLQFDPKRTIVFAAFDVAGGEHFVAHPFIPAAPSDSWTVVILDGVGAGDPRLARLELGSGLARAFDQSARRFGVRTEDLTDWDFFFVGGDPRRGRVSWDVSYSGLAITRPGDDLSGTTADTMEHLDPNMLAEAGRAVAHYLMVLSSR